jgi:hypothetical protein
VSHDADPYAALLALTEREHAVVTAGEWEPLGEIDRERRRLMAALPAVPPPRARPALERCLHLQAQTSALLSAGVVELRRTLGHVAQGRTAIRGYGGTLDAPPARLDLTG